MRSEKFLWWKFLLGYALYVFFHEINRLFPGIIGTIFGEGIESVYAHMKMLFYAYLILTIIDYFRLRKGGLPPNFFHARMFILAAVPWMMIAVFYALQAAGVPLPGKTELAWALLITAWGIYLCMRLEEPLENMDMKPSLKNTILIAFLAAFITYVGFSFHVPDNFFIVTR